MGMIANYQAVSDTELEQGFDLEDVYKRKSFPFATSLN